MKVKKFGPLEVHYREREQNPFYDEEADLAWQNVKDEFAKALGLYLILDWLERSINRITNRF